MATRTTRSPRPRTGQRNGNARRKSPKGPRASNEPTLDVECERRLWLSCRDNCEEFSQSRAQPDGRPFPPGMREAFGGVAARLGSMLKEHEGELVTLTNTADKWHGLLHLLDHPPLVRRLSAGTCDVMRAVASVLRKHDFPPSPKKSMSVPRDVMDGARAAIEQLEKEDECRAHDGTASKNNASA